MSDDENEAEAPVLKFTRAPLLVRDMFEAKGYAEIDEEEPENDGKPWHVHWKGGKFTPSQYAAASCVQRVNHFPKTMGITKKQVDDRIPLDRDDLVAHACE